MLRTFDHVRTTRLPFTASSRPGRSIGVSTGTTHLLRFTPGPEPILKGSHDLSDPSTHSFDTSSDVPPEVPQRFKRSLLRVAADLEGSTSVSAAARAVADLAFNLIDRAVVVRISIVEAGLLREIATAGDRHMASDRDAPRELALESHRTVETRLARPAGYRLLDIPFGEGAVPLGVLEVAAPSEVLPDVKPLLAWIGWQMAKTIDRLAHEAQIIAARKREVSKSFTLGLKVATAVGRAGERRKAYREIVRVLGREMKSPAIAWRVHPREGRLEVLETAGVSWRPKEDLMLRCSVISRDSRARLLHEVRECARFTLRLPKVTLVDAGDVVITLGGEHPALEGSGKWLHELLASVPDLSATVTLRDDPATSERRLLEGLTDRERDILALLAAGLGTDAIAQTLVISPNTVKTHVQNILGKLGVSSRLEAAAMASRAGLVSSVAS